MWVEFVEILLGAKFLHDRRSGGSFSNSGGSNRVLHPQQHRLQEVWKISGDVLLLLVHSLWESKEAQLNRFKDTGRKSGSA